MDAEGVVVLAGCGGFVLGVVFCWVWGWSWGLRERRWRCRGCGHSYTTHIEADGQAGACAEGSGDLSRMLLSGVCPCMAYVGRVPPVRLLHVGHGVTDDTKAATGNE